MAGESLETQRSNVRAEERRDWTTRTCHNKHSDEQSRSRGGSRNTYLDLTERRKVQDSFGIVTTILRSYVSR